MAADTGLNATAAALLGLLHSGPMTGGQLTVAAQARLSPFWTTTRSQVYRELPSLAERGLVRSGKPGPRSSQPYTVSAAGRRAFARWLSEPAGNDHFRNPLLLRTAFGALHTQDQLAQLYETKSAEHATALARLREQLRDARRGEDAFAVATLEFAVTYQRALVRWLATAPRP